MQKMAVYTKKDAVRIVVGCAKKYEQELADKKLLLVCSDKHHNVSCVELAFYKRNYLHLTGLKLHNRYVKDKTETSAEQDVISAEDFYTRCLAGRLSVEDFDFASDGTTSMKLDVLPFVITKNLSANMLGNYNLSRPTLYTEKLAGSVKACVGFVEDKQTKSFVPNTVLKDDIKTVVTNYVRIIAVFRKDIHADSYHEVTHVAKGIEPADINFPPEYMYLHNIFLSDEDAQ